MGQGAESCGGYEVEYNPYDSGSIDDIWTQRSGATIKVSDMTDSHIKKAITVCNKAAMVANFSCDEEMWLDWVDVFENELWDRKGKNKSKSVVSKSETLDKTQKPKKFSRGVSVVMVCHCGKEYSACQADLNRGWGLSCSKRCAAIRREFGRPAAKKKGV